VQPLTYCDDLPLPPKEEILHRLAGRAGRDALIEILRLLCPCRNTCRDADVWRAVRSLYRHHVRDVREGAHHAVMSLQERARIDTQTASLLRELGVGAGHQRRLQKLWRDGVVETPKPVRNDVPTLIEMLASDDPIEQRDALDALFGDHEYRVGHSVWDEFERAATSTDPRLRAKASTATRRLRERRATAA
jgi:hypothetical protein